MVTLEFGLRKNVDLLIFKNVSVIPLRVCSNTLWEDTISRTIYCSRHLLKIQYPIKHVNHYYRVFLMPGTKKHKSKAR